MALADTTNAANPVHTLPASPDAVIDSLRGLISSTYLNHDVSTVQIRAGALFARLKALNRSANTATRSHKQATAETRHDMDQIHLGLQNLLYEKRHLEREIEKCRQFASVYQDIPLYTLEEFLERAPEDMRTEEILGNEHSLMLSQLNFELAERQRLDKECKRLQAMKDELLKESKTRLATMDKVKVQIDELMKVRTRRSYDSNSSKCPKPSGQHSTDVQNKVADLVKPLESTVPAESAS
ncbi:uncharacterized protein PHACADRAFT_25195 [Phanerochaete carnosa HHB-10118-sp]|uniref:Fms interacting protein n=1 Tax=Phanerochaete carnosa (strain HHB-10118-sp) TaxID=650164 RepID=K5X868_PHACS|nr:uncharacterized protein PHACADRAFT_25195 [Phanerochaete carnosa HHB-10118-sp]EKM59072.1 hypothetical protein PHACADRAFT_25195 [Phanerochaete carnosa HHB-10118-sp]